MFRLLLTYLLLLSLLGQLFSREVIVMSFNLNRDFIARNFCVNQNRPKLQCNGSCYLTKKLKAQQERENREAAQQLHKLPVVTLFCAAFFEFAYGGTTLTLASRPADWVYFMPTYAALLSGPFQPPRLG